MNRNKEMMKVRLLMLSNVIKSASIILCLQNAWIDTFLKIYQRQEDIYFLRDSVTGALSLDTPAALLIQYLLQAWGLQHRVTGRIYKHHALVPNGNWEFGDWNCMWKKRVLCHFVGSKTEAHTTPDLFKATVHSRDSLRIKTNSLWAPKSSARPMNYPVQA